MLIYLKKIIPITLVLIAVVCLPVSAKVLLNYDFDNNVGTLGTVGIQRNTEKAVAEVRKAEDGNLFARITLPASESDYKYQYALVKQLLNDKNIITFEKNTVYKFSMDIKSEITAPGNSIYLFCWEYTDAWNTCFIQADCLEAENGMLTIRFYNPATTQIIGTYTVKKGNFFCMEAVFDADTRKYDCYCNGVKINPEPIELSDDSLTKITKLGFRFHSSIPCKESFADYDNICVSSYEKADSASYAISFKKDGNEISRLENGEITAEFYVDSNSVEDGGAVTLVTAYYNDGKLVDVAYDEEKFVSGSPLLLSAGVNVNDSSFSNSLKAFLFESLETLRPLQYEPRVLGGWGDAASAETEMAMQCAYLMNVVSPHIFTYKLPENAIVDNLQDGIHTTQTNGISFDENGAGGKGGSLVYGIGGQNAWIITDERKADSGFKTEFISGASEYTEILPVEKADFEFNGRLYSIYRFSSFPQENGWLKITVNDESLHIRSVFANLDFSDEKLVSTVKSYFPKEQSGSGVTLEKLQSYKEVVLKNLKENYAAQSFISTMLSDGSWADINYNSAESYVHLQRCKDIALEIYSLQENDDKIASLSKALDYYFNQNISLESAWYVNHITVPQELSEILLLAGSQLPKQTESAIKSYLENKRTYLNSIYTFTGANEMEISLWMINLALYTSDTKNLQVSLNRIESELMMITKLESQYNPRKVFLNGVYSGMPGIQTDYSGLFHESQLYSGGYCMTLVKKISIFLSDAYESGLTDGLYLEDYIDHILEHYSWIFYKKQMDFNTVGRYIALMGTDENGNTVSNSTTNSNGTSMKQTLGRLAAIDGIYRSEELQSFARLWSASIPTTSYVEGNRYFYKPYYMVNQKQSYMASLRMSSDRVNASEQVSWCNLKGKYLADGCMYIYRTTEEFNDIFAAWDWNKIPGTTSFSDKQIVYSENQDYKNPGSDTKLAGGVSDANHGVAAMQLVREGLSAKKAWFMFDNEIVCLGSDISNTTDYNAITTVNQCITADIPVIYDGKSELLLEENLTYEGSESGFVLNDRMGYVFGSGESIRAEVGNKTGDRYDINFDGNSEKPDKSIPVTKRIFSLWLDHTGNNLYSYIIVPDTDKDGLYQYLGEENPIEVIENSESAMAVRHKELKKTLYVFWQAGSCGEIEASAPCVIIVEDTDSGYSVSAAALSYEEKSLTLCFDGELYGCGSVYSDDRTYVTAALAQGEFAGKAVKIKLTEAKGVK